MVKITIVPLKWLQLEVRYTGVPISIHFQIPSAVRMP